ncbi:hypothetical protein [Methylotenera sp.]|uniref:hypothetical protein n=1 Tax=Methylotenera sp. TaxID=2051956 RepID=UPI002ED885D5
MVHSKTIKDQASLAKRTGTSINKIVDQLELDFIKNQSEGINREDRNTLIKAASILSKLGSIKTSIAKKAESAEAEKEKAINLAELEAKKIITNWKSVETNLDKVALIIGGRLDYSLESYLKDGLPIWNREVTSEDWLHMLNELTRDANKAIASDAAFHAVTKNKSILEVMSAAEEKLLALKKHSRTLLLAKEWAAKINP